LIQLGAIRPGRSRQGPPGRRVDHVQCAGAIDEPSIDQQSEIGFDIPLINGVSGLLIQDARRCSFGFHFIDSTQGE
jgi:hypothetical protein